MSAVRQRAALVLAVVTGGWLLGMRAYEGVDMTTRLIAPGEIAAAQTANVQFECLEHAIRRAAPRGTAVLVDIEDVLWRQRASAAVFLDHVLVASEDEADVVLRLASPASPAPCAEGGIAANPPKPGA